MEKVQSVLVAARKAADPKLHPPGVPHRGGSEPKLDARGYVSLCMFCSARIGEQLPSPRRPDLVLARKLGQQVIDEELTEPAKIEAALKTMKQSPAPMTIVRSILMEARLTLVSPDMVGTSTRAAATKTIKLLPEDEVTSFLEELDEEILRLDSVAMVARKSKRPTAKIVRTLARLDNVWITRLADGRYGGLLKIGSRWAFEEGTRDHVLALVPPALFERAVDETTKNDV